MKRKKLLLLGALPLCALIIGVLFVFNHVASPAHASSARCGLNGDLTIGACISADSEEVDAFASIQNNGCASSVTVSLYQDNTQVDSSSSSNVCGNVDGPSLMNPSPGTYYSKVSVCFSDGRCKGPLPSPHVTL